MQREYSKVLICINPESLSLFFMLCFAQISRREFEEIYDILDISIEERGESFYNKMIPGVLDDLVEKKIAVESDGALCVFKESDQDKEARRGRLREKGGKGGGGSRRFTPSRVCGMMY